MLLDEGKQGWGDKPVVSIVVIFLNAEQFIREAIESAFAQTYKCWELLLVDDGSADGSKAIAHQYAALYPERVLYLEHHDHQNRGMSASRNLGVSHARGKYIAFLDADDVWLPHKL
jgi:glycosyltransferase involved in cell wall biosynthesis